MFFQNPLDQFFIYSLLDNLFFLLKFFFYMEMSNAGYFALFMIFIVVLLLDMFYYSLLTFISIFSLGFLMIMTILQSVLSVSDSDLFNFFFLWFLSLALILFFFNITGLFPYGFTLTSHLVVSLTFSSTFFLWMNFVYFCRFSVLGFGAFVPSGSPVSILFLIVPMELMSYVSSILSLAIRLFANMMAGHTLLHILSSFLYASLCWNIVLILPLALLNAIFMMELGVALLQIYVFLVLCYLYVQDTLACAH